MQHISMILEAITNADEDDEFEPSSSDESDSISDSLNDEPKKEITAEAEVSY